MYLNQNLTFVFMPAMRETYFSKIKEKKNEKKKKKRLCLQVHYEKVKKVLTMNSSSAKPLLLLLS